MKIAYVLNTYPQPSQSFIRREIQALERRGIEVVRLPMRAPDQVLRDPGDLAEASHCHYVLRAGAARLLWSFLATAVRAPGRTWGAFRLAVHLARVGGSWLRPVIYLAEAAYVLRVVRQEGCSHLHAHFGTNATAVAMLTEALGGPGYSFTTHGPEEFDAPKSLSLGLKVDRSCFAVAVSSFGRSQLSRWASFGAWSRIKVVHCAIEPNRFPAPHALPEGALEVVAIGRFVEQKGQMVLLLALAEAVRTAPDLHLTLVGDGAMRADLEAAVAAHDLARNVTFTGWLPEAGVLDVLARAHALVMPSFAEGLPMVIMEAMAAGRPVLATYVAGTPELVVPEETGWLVPAGDVQSLADALVRMSKEPRSRLQEMGAAARRRVLLGHDVDIEAEKLAGHFATAIKGRAG
ncbi:glycosyltransferase family 4 protein [Phaeobacter sp. B1627]|uniref:glycosyltransferase family 4 protein n=1 Tax=Phaeobacter sp. B1627 TaxID=2583809 RepID=UPI00111B8DDD|nr:glycosyltransferase family 4 protein [Phaeobacter sp. B1627]TNJ42073.1 glycosyltransferase family 4 protein [Phaeobacter sp. B1627]